MAATPDEPKEPPNLKTRLKESYDAIAPIYNTWTATQHSPIRIRHVDGLVARLSDASSKKISILELGAGAGLPATAHLLSSLPNAHVTANDISSTQVALGRANLASVSSEAESESDRVTWIEGDMVSVLEFPDESLDAVMGLYSLIHLPLAEQELMLGRIYRWLKPGRGYLLANFAEFPEEGLVMEKWLHEQGWMFWSGFGAEQTLEKLQDVGFEVELSKLEEDEVDVRFLWVLAKKPAREV